MFGTIRKHQNWLWAVIIVVIVISFVIYFSPDARWGGGRGRGRASSELGSIDGQPISIQDYHEAYRETQLLYFLNFQKWPENDDRARQMGFDVENEAKMRLIRIAKIKAEKIAISDETVADLARRLLGPKVPLDGFVKEILAPHGLTEVDFERFLRNDAAIQQLGSVAGLTGRLIPPREIEASYREEHQEAALDVVLFNTSNYLSSVTVAEPALLQWYSNNAALFRVSDKARVSYVEFAVTNFFADVDKRLSEITNLNAQLEEVYSKKDPESFKDESGKVLSKDAAILKIKNTERKRMAMPFAEKKANEFAGALYDEKQHRVEDLEKLAAAQGLKPRVTAPFDEENGPEDIKVADEFSRTAFALTNKDEAIAFKIVRGEEGCYVFGLKEIIPSYNPKFEDIRAKVVERYRFAEAQKLARQAGMAFQISATNGLAKGKSFTAVVTEANLKATTLPPISRGARDVELPESLYLPQVKNVAFSLEAGKASPYIPSMGGGYVLYLRSLLPIDEAKMKTDLVQYAATIRGQRQNEAYGMWFRRQVERADLPALRTTPRSSAPPRQAPPTRPKQK